MEVTVTVQIPGPARPRNYVVIMVTMVVVIFVPIAEDFSGTAYLEPGTESDSTMWDALPEPHFMYEKMVSLRGLLTCPRSQSK